MHMRLCVHIYMLTHRHGRLYMHIYRKTHLHSQRLITQTTHTPRDRHVPNLIYKETHSLTYMHTCIQTLTCLHKAHPYMPHTDSISSDTPLCTHIPSQLPFGQEKAVSELPCGGCRVAPGRVRPTARPSPAASPWPLTSAPMMPAQPPPACLIFSPIHQQPL